jgi:hypothetical protein
MFKIITGQLACSKIYSTRGPKKRRSEPGRRSVLKNNQIGVHILLAISKITFQGYMPVRTSACVDTPMSLA